MESTEIQMIRSLSEQLRARLDSRDSEQMKLVQRSLLLYRQNLVYQLRVHGPEEVTAVVQDVVPVKVKLSPSNIENSSCQCPQEGLCRHQLAVFFALLAKHESVSNWINEWRRSESPSLQHLPIQKGHTPPTTTAEEQFSQWIHKFDHVWANFNVSELYQNNPFIKFYQQLKWQEPENRQIKLIYRLALQIFIVKKWFESQPNNAPQQYSVIHLDYYADEIKQTIRTLTRQMIMFESDDYFHLLSAQLRDVMKDGQGHLIERFSLYTDFWTQLFKSPSIRQEERDWWTGYIQEERPRFSDQPTVYIAFWHIQILTGHEKEVLQSLEDNMEPSYIYLLLNWLDYFIAENQWSRANTFFAKLIKWWSLFTDSADASVIEEASIQALHLSKIYSGKRNFPLQEKLLEVLLPHSFHEYTTFMFQTKRYDKWVELLQSVAYKVEEVPHPYLVEIEEVEPHLLLPFYHRAVVELVNEKKRQSYRDAVVYLKKCKRIYETIQSTSKWDVYFRALLEKTSRLRAFHEECRRGNLINGSIKEYQN